MAAQQQPIDEFRRLRNVAARTRGQAIRSQLALGFTFCRIAQAEFEYGHVDQANVVLGQLRKLVQTVRRHLNEPFHVLADEVGKIQVELAALEIRIVAVEEYGQRSR